MALFPAPGLGVEAVLPGIALEAGAPSLAEAVGVEAETGFVRSSDGPWPRTIASYLDRRLSIHRLLLSIFVRLESCRTRARKMAAMAIR